MSYDDAPVVDLAKQPMSIRSSRQPGDNPAEVTIHYDQQVPRSSKVNPGEVADYLKSKGYSDAGAAGILQNIQRESGFDPGNVGDGGTSYGLFQHHNERKAGLEAFAKQRGTSPSDWRTQVDFADQELQRDMPALRKQLQGETDPVAAENAFRRVFERPASGGGYDSAKAVAAPGYSFSPDAIPRAQKAGADVVYMSPQDYLDLVPNTMAPHNDSKGRSLRQSLAKGEQVNDIPTLDVEGGKVVDQDGAHRAQFALDAGIESIPVAIKRTGGPAPKELVGMSGRVVPWDFTPAKPQPKSFLQGFGTGLKDIAVGAARLATSDPLDLLGVPSGLSAEDEARLPKVGKVVEKYAADREKGIEDERAAAGETGVDWSRLAGNVAGTLPLAALAPAAGAGTAARLGAAAVGGAASGALSPTGSIPANIGLGALAGGAGGAVAGATGRVISPKIKDAVRFLLDKGVKLTPGQIAGGVGRAVESKATSIPLVGDAIAGAERRAVESFNAAAWNEALAPLKQELPANVPVGRAAVNYVADQISAIYNRVLPKISVTPDKNLADDLIDIAKRAKAAPLPDPQLKQFMSILTNQVGAKLSNAATDGEIINGMDSMLGQAARGYRGDPSYDNRVLGGFIEEIQGAVRDMVSRQAPPEASAELQAARKAYAVFVRVSRAASAQGARDGVFSPAQLANAVRSEASSPRKLAYGKGNAMLQNLSDAGLSVLPQSVPDSGTAGRAMVGALAGGGAGYAMSNPAIPLAMLAGAAPYTRVGNFIARKLMAGAPVTRNALADAVGKAGQIAAPGVAQLARPGPQP